MKTDHLFLLTSFFLIVGLQGRSQSVDNSTTLITTDYTIACGLGMVYNSTITIQNDTIRLFNPGKNGGVASEYLILEKKEKWKTPNYHGKASYQTILLSDSSDSKHRVKLTLRKGKGFVDIYDAGFCEKTIKVNIDEEYCFVWRNRFNMGGFGC